MIAKENWPVICWWCTRNVAAINSTNCILEVGPEFGIIAYLRWDRLSTSGQADMIGVKWRGKYDNHVFEIPR